MPRVPHIPHAQALAESAPVGRPKDQIWFREPGSPFDDLAREQYAQARAKGATLRAASQAAGISKESARPWERDERMRQRVRELRQGATDFIGVSTAWIIAQLKTNAEEARKVAAFKSSNEALGMIYKIMKADPELPARAARSLDPSFTPEQVQRELRASFTEVPRPAVDDAIDVEPEEDDEAAE